jgi:hypothetical protein
MLGFPWPTFSPIWFGFRVTGNLMSSSKQLTDKFLVEGLQGYRAKPHRDAG